MATSEYRGLMGAGFPQGYPGSFGPLIRYGSPDGFTGGQGITAPGMNSQPYYRPSPIGMPGAPDEDDQSDWKGQYGASWQDIADRRQWAKKNNKTINPYGNLGGSEGGGRTFPDWVRKEGRDFGDPQTMSDFMKILAGYRGAWNPTGERNPYHRGMYGGEKGLNATGHGGFLNYMTRPEKVRYSKARYSYDNGLRGGLKDVNTYENKRNMEAENPGSTKQLRPYSGGVWQRDGTLEVPDEFEVNR